MNVKNFLYLFAFLVLGSTWGAEPVVYPNRWVRVSSGLREDSEVERIRGLIATSAAHGLTGIALSAGLDSLDLKPPEYFDRLRQVRRMAEEQGLSIIPSFFSSGYGGAVLSHNRNLAAALPVRDALFVSRQGRAVHAADPGVKIVNGGFEQVTGEPSLPAGFELSAPEGVRPVVDSEVHQSGSAAVRFENLEAVSEGWVRLSQPVDVQPFRQYRLSVWVRAENLGESDPFGSGNFLLEVLGGEEKRPLQYENPRFERDGKWHEAAVGFNSLDYDRVEIAPRVRAGTAGQLWLDELRLEEVGLVNVVRRPGTPVTVRGESSGTVYREGRDYVAISDPELNFRYDHGGPVIELVPGGGIAEGERLRVSYFHGTRIYNGQTPICMSEPEVYEIWETQVRLVHEALAPQKYLLNMDEVRTGGYCEACRARSISLGQIFGEAVTRQFDMIRKVNPAAEVFVWSDMLDPNHNANPERKYYYLTSGNFVGSWNYIPRELKIVCWHFGKREPSLKHFSSLGFETLAGAYYDADDLDNVKGWLEALSVTPGAAGIMYTTWLDKYELLDEFGDLVSGRSLNHRGH